ncbi:hypothetical protein SASPL_122980 [Salvia splendens]|uniref:6,7-dimethyl-8-ribityllumazine synthase n=1 Tax=Salvia splendens TaxID=180675 RepID=A0A8X8XML1_SALSN|nr:uncharacterized protein LOC121744149 [Salvia splendens]KAG6415567.1 hypothetical protein SASPL_122980 [Salvia splendens]
MGNSLRCCLACVLPCGALDLIRIVHLNGSVDEITGRVTAGEILKNNPNHLLTKPCSQGMARRILILSPESDLKRGSIYFLIPSSSLPAHKNNQILKKLSPCRKNSSEVVVGEKPAIVTVKMPEKKQSSRRHHHRSRSNAGVAWTPYLESISED